jgi:hypothetical protein
MHSVCTHQCLLNCSPQFRLVQQKWHNQNNLLEFRLSKQALLLKCGNSLSIGILMRLELSYMRKTHIFLLGWMYTIKGICNSGTLSSSLVNQHWISSICISLQVWQVLSLYKVYKRLQGMLTFFQRSNILCRYIFKWLHLNKLIKVYSTWSFYHA